MTTRQEILDSMINDYKTTMNSDYRENAIKPVIKTVYQEKKPFIREKWTYVKYIHTMRNWDGERAPFDSTIPTKAIIRTNPHNIQPVYVSTLSIINHLRYFKQPERSETAQGALQKGTPKVCELQSCNHVEISHISVHFVGAFPQYLNLVSKNN